MTRISQCFDNGFPNGKCSNGTFSNGKLRESLMLQRSKRFRGVERRLTAGLFMSLHGILSNPGERPNSVGGDRAPGTVQVRWTLSAELMNFVRLGRSPVNFTLPVPRFVAGTGVWRGRYPATALAVYPPDI